MGTDALLYDFLDFAYALTSECCVRTRVCMYGITADFLLSEIIGDVISKSKFLVASGYVSQHHHNTFSLLLFQLVYFSETHGSA